MVPDSTPFERELISGCQQGNAKHQEMLYKHFFGFAMGTALRYTASRQEAMSIVNDSFLKVFGHISRYTFETTFKGWLRRIVVNTALDHYRRTSRELPVIDPDGPEGQLAESDANIISQLTAEDILNLLNQLPPQYRLVFNLYEIEGYSHEEIAQQLGLSVSSSRVYLVRAKEQLSRLVKHHFHQVNERSCR
ncbi:RNA polymerase sigma factor [Fibrisoma montanum]|uniref:RNA polymerase sigma factor n=1 Tax=Fibrisoma montanum TaxID=2305895 RepID=A0A418M2T7_9BACT|nr:RNA polymerase sigma factor [Fibrisoma montanum]RIV19986.1 RNA polymerase sigma factor [Fibrisoma montanum]